MSRLPLWLIRKAKSTCRLLPSAETPTLNKGELYVHFSLETFHPEGTTLPHETVYVAGLPQSTANEFSHAALAVNDCIPNVNTEINRKIRIK